MPHPLDAVFDDPSAQSLSAREREPVTRALEAALDEIIDVVRPGGFIEIGAFEAGFSRRMRRRFPSASVIAFEANPRVHDRFAAEVKAAGVDYRHTAVADAEGEMTFHIVETVAGTAMPVENRMGSIHEIALRDSRSVPVTVPAMRLDMALADIVAADLCLWVDVEGAAGAVLRGAAATLERTAIVYCELETRVVWKGQTMAAEALTMLDEAGFVLAARDCQKVFQKNCLFLRPEAMADARVSAILAGYDEKARALMKAAIGSRTP